ncbi:hypothetical protein AWW66_25265 [Micromonospora rosaria]|uniref:Uncharacterized protein n=1 Tax=Micromonospora rosaria TaxID=47874 RepID=A0A136PLH4_9ACTN|nr:hypothetical protein [Micromonospora rosaria]KXK59262.1 hypothetical protein AWW66_25265 [Micromonospora rosaria]
MARAEADLRALFERELAAPHAEVEARLCEDESRRRQGLPLFFPHILQEALNNLVAAGDIEKVQHPTRAGRTAELYVLATTGRGRRTAITAATRRKGLLYARFLHYSTLFGAAGESVVRDSLVDAAAHGYQSMSTHTPFGEVRKIGSAQLQGALDSGAWLMLMHPDTHLPLPAQAITIEVKNRRLHLYPRHDEVHQLLHKAAVVQDAHPELPVVPVLICRRAHSRLFWMAKDLGFLVHQTRRQFVTLPPKTEPRMLEELRNELALTDLTLVSREHPKRIEGLFTTTLPKQSRLAAARWKAVGSTLVKYYAELRDQRLKPWVRTSAVGQLRTAAELALDHAQVADPILEWALEDDDDPDQDF